MDDFAIMDRRALMRSLGLLLGAASLPTLAGCKAALEGEGALDEARLKLLTAIADTMIPETDTPGAVAAGVPRLISGLLRDWAAKQTREDLIGAIDAIGKLAGGNFAALKIEERTALLKPYDLAAVAPGTPDPKAPKKSALAAMMAGPPKANPPYVRLKSLIINLYYNSEIAMTKEVVYEHVPGKFVPSIKITPDTRPYAGVGGIF